MNVFLTILSYVIMAAILIGMLAILKKFVFSKVRINKFIPLGLAIAGLVYQFFFMPENATVGIGVTAVIVLLFAWFWDINQTGGPKKINEKKIVVKPKAKPNRVKKDN